MVQYLHFRILKFPLNMAILVALVLATFWYNMSMTWISWNIEIPYHTHMLHCARIFIQQLYTPKLTQFFKVNIRYMEHLGHNNPAYNINQYHTSPWKWQHTKHNKQPTSKNTKTAPCRVLFRINTYSSQLRIDNYPSIFHQLVFPSLVKLSCGWKTQFVAPPSNENILEVSWRFIIPGGNHTFHRAFRAQLDFTNHHGWTTKSRHHLVVVCKLPTMNVAHFPNGKPLAFHIFRRLPKRK